MTLLDDGHAPTGTVCEAIAGVGRGGLVKAWEDAEAEGGAAGGLRPTLAERGLAGGTRTGAWLATGPRGGVLSSLGCASMRLFDPTTIPCLSI